jgi:hypothetical protein
MIVKIYRQGLLDVLLAASSSSGATVHDEPWPLLRLLSIRLKSVKVSQQLKLFMGWGRQPHAKPPTWRARVSPFFWIITAWETLPAAMLLPA